MPVYKNSSNQITLDQAISLHEKGIAVIVNDGKDVTFERGEGQ
ncbi:MAG: hypothetical protein QHH10_08110 [Peptococcaceae bacterium]|jgi:hypothetical protein|nr:hypothetical protein [Peptococcaceae bacterium]MDH7525257.1 hypothetical protein [Peptococcaceae bacterium]